MTKKPKYELDMLDPMMSFFIKGYMAAHDGQIPSFEDLNIWLSKEIETNIKKEKTNLKE